MKKYEEPQLKCAMFSSESISAAAETSQVSPDQSKTDLNKWLNTKGVNDDIAVVNWTEMGN